MNFQKFLESTYVTTNQELQAEYKAYTHAKTLATKDLIDMQRSFFQFIAKVEIVIRFISLKLHIIKQPLTAEELFKAAEQPEAIPEPEFKSGSEYEAVTGKPANYHI
jgi:hypothetical protein